MRQKISAAQRDLIGIVGEIHAYRFLRLDFGVSLWARTLGCQKIGKLSYRWWKESRMIHAMRMASTFGFHIEARSGLWRSRRLAGMIPISTLASPKSKRPVGLRDEGERMVAAGEFCVFARLSLSGPEFDWLPNPFEDDHRKRFRLHKGGMRVSYFRIPV